MIVEALERTRSDKAAAVAWQLGIPPFPLKRYLKNFVTTNVSHRSSMD